MEMPTPCQHCGEIFDLHDGCTSEKWYPNTIICEPCGIKEDKEVELENEIQELRDQIEDELWSIKQAVKRLKELNADNIPTIINCEE